jgi:hypothetical protein
MGIPLLPPRPRVRTMALIRTSIPLLGLSDQALRVWTFPSSSASCGGHTCETQAGKDGCKLYLFFLTCAPH